jgi:hypothetical protein
MPLLNGADAVFAGDRPVDAVYQGGEKIWPAEPTHPPHYFEPLDAVREGRCEPMVYVVRSALFTAAGLKGELLDDAHTIKISWENAFTTTHIFSAMTSFYIGNYFEVYDHQMPQIVYRDFDGMMCGARGQNIPPNTLDPELGCTLLWLNDWAGDAQQQDGMWVHLDGAEPYEYFNDWEAFTPQFGPSPGRGVWQGLLAFKQYTTHPPGSFTITDPYGYYVPFSSDQIRNGPGGERRRAVRDRWKDHPKAPYGRYEPK